MAARIIKPAFYYSATEIFPIFQSSQSLLQTIILGNSSGFLSNCRRLPIFAWCNWEGGAVL